MNPIDRGNDAAVARVEDTLERLTRVDLQLVVVSAPDPGRRAARERARRAADEAGRAALFKDSSAAAREIAIQAFSRGGFSANWAATERSASVASAQDRVAAAAAFEEAAMAAVVEDLVDADTLEVLGATVGGLQVFRDVPAPGSLSTFTERAGIDLRGLGPIPVVIAGVCLVVGAVIWVTLGLGAGLLTIALGATLAGWLARRGGGDAR